MADNTKIEWTEATWSPITGCTLVSEGCRNCYAATLAATRLKHHPSRAGLARMNADGVAKFTGEVRINEQWLDQPLRWRRPRMIFVCAHGDLFHEAVPDEWIDRVFAAMTLAPHHTFQVLTKRPERMRAYMSGLFAGDGYRPLVRRPGWTSKDPRNGDCVFLLEAGQTWPLPNVWLGVSVEDQPTADARVPILLDTPAAVRWVSAEPLLGPVSLDWLPHEHDGDGVIDALLGCDWIDGFGYGVAYKPSRPGHEDRTMTREVVNVRASKLDWVVVGGESGRHARPMHPDWARSIRDQCAAAGVAFHFKQWGEFLPVGQVLPGCGRIHGATAVKPGRMRLHYAGAKRRQPEYAFAEGGVEFSSTSDGRLTFCVGKKRAGRLLDGVEHNGFPEVV